MDKIKSHLYALTKRDLLLGLYPLFLFVQCFCIPQYSHYSAIEKAQLVCSSQNENAKQKISPNDKPVHPQKHYIRLSKRFQPGSTPMIVDIPGELCVLFNDADKTSPPEEYLFISFILTFSFRGPPVVA